MQKVIQFISIFIIITGTGWTLEHQEFKIRKANKIITMKGYTRSNASMTVASEVAGKIIIINYNIGEKIQKKSFFEIDPTFINFQIESTRKAMRKLDIGLEQLHSQSTYLKKEFQRIDQLHQGDRATGVRRDAAKEKLKQAQFELKSLELEKAMVKTTLEELQERRARHKIYAPKGWVVVDQSLEKGEIITPHQPLARVADFRTLVVPLYVSTVEYKAIASLPPKFKASLEGQSVNAVIKQFNPEFNPELRKLSLEIQIYGQQEPRGGLRFSLPLSIETKGCLIPKIAVSNRYDNPRVQLKTNGKIVAVIILGESGDDLIVAEDAKLPLGGLLVNPN